MNPDHCIEQACVWKGLNNRGPAILCQLCQLELVLRCPLHLVVLYLADPVLPLQDHAPSDLNAASMVTKCHLVGLGFFLGMYHCRLPPWVFRSVISDHHWVPHHKASLYSCRPRVHLCCLIFECTFLHIWYRKLLRSLFFNNWAVEISMVECLAFL